MQVKPHAMIIFSAFCEPIALKYLSCGRNTWFRIGPIFCEKKRISTLEKRIKKIVFFATRPEMYFKYALHGNLHVTSSNANFNKNDNLSYLLYLLSKISPNNHCKPLHSRSDTSVHLLWTTFQIMFTVKDSIQAALPLSTCCVGTSPILQIMLIVAIFLQTVITVRNCCDLSAT